LAAQKVAPQKLAVGDRPLRKTSGPAQFSRQRAKRVIFEFIDGLRQSVVGITLAESVRVNPVFVIHLELVRLNVGIGVIGCKTFPKSVEETVGTNYFGK
jgi:hypothetical protein